MFDLNLNGNMKVS